MSTSESGNAIKIIRKPAGVPVRTAAGHKTSIAGFEIGGGKLGFDPDMGNFTDVELGCFMLASFGLNSKVIGSKLYISEHTVKTNFRRATGREHIPNQRAGFARHFLDKGIFRLIEPAESLCLSAREYEVVEEISHGKTNGEVAETLGIAENTIKSHVARISARGPWRGREQISLLALAAQDIGPYALQAINLASPDSWTPEGGLIVPEPIVPMPRQEMIHERN
jgi:DNA-binding CsgD family transcriptional regulator